MRLFENPVQWSGIICSFVLLWGLSAPANAAQKELAYFPGVPYPIVLLDESGCGFFERELELIVRTLDRLPPSFRTIDPAFRIEKKCETSGLVSETLPEGARVVIGRPYPGKLVLKDRLFEFFKDGKKFYLSDKITMRMIAHELIHMLDRQHHFSDSEAFRAINRWKTTMGVFHSVEAEKAEGFYRTQSRMTPKEDLATAAEGYFFDPAFICAHPAMYAWFSTHVGPAGIEPAACPALSHPIDPEKVVAAGVVFVSATDSHIESQFGHSMLHFHDGDADPFNDYLVQAAAHPAANAPVVTGFESQEELDRLRESLQPLQIGTLEYIGKGIAGGFPLRVIPIKYKLKWLQTVVLEGRDIAERVLELTPLQLRLLTYLVNRDIQSIRQDYRFFGNNCATYIAETLNKVFAKPLIDTNWVGAYSPGGVFTGVEPRMARELPLIEGDLRRLKQLLPDRKAALKEMIGWEEFSELPIKNLAKVKDAQVSAELFDALMLVVRTHAGNWPADRLAVLKRFVYTFTTERARGLRTRGVAAYKELLLIERRTPDTALAPGPLL